MTRTFLVGVQSRKKQKPIYKSIGMSPKVIKLMTIQNEYLRKNRGRDLKGSEMNEHQMKMDKNIREEIEKKTSWFGQVKRMAGDKWF